MFTPLPLEKYAILARLRYPTFDREFHAQGLFAETDGLFNNPQNTAPVYLGLAQLAAAREALADASVEVDKRGAHTCITIEGSEGLRRVYEVPPKQDGVLVVDPLNPQTIEERLYLREEFIPHLAVPESLLQTPIQVASRIFEIIFNNRGVRKVFPEFQTQYGITTLKDMRTFALRRGGCSQSPNESPLFEVYQRFDGTYVVPVDTRAELLLTDHTLEVISSKPPPD